MTGGQARRRIAALAIDVGAGAGTPAGNRNAMRHGFYAKAVSSGARYDACWLARKVQSWLDGRDGRRSRGHVI
jgi:hypothetical protein